ncbi:dienelactone hydrolase family protein [Kitasatospora indigofera]|uniref:dienelactone hydrolase family protein n=1 Tax=Kitasatospora indigofera TaxID=67307 RepID=UPI0033A39DA8
MRAAVRDAAPAGAGGYPAVLAGAELWGLTEEIRDVVRQVAALRYVAIAPNLYHRSGPETAAGRLDLAAAAAVFYPGWLPAAGTALSRPEPLLDAVTGGIAERDVRVLMIFAELDHVIDAEQRDRIGAGPAASGVRHELVVYPGARHAFFFPGREPYDKAAAENSWLRVRELFAAELG